MGVVWKDCNICGKSFPDCGDFVRCDCGNTWCSYECAWVDGYRVDKEENEEFEEENSCKWCREEDFSDSELLEFILKNHNLTRDKLVNEYKQFVKNNTIK